MKKCLFLAFALFPLFLPAQQRPTPIYIAPDAPAWMVMMQADTPNVPAIQEAYRDYYATHPFRKNAYTQFYKRWIHWARPYTQADGEIHLPTVEEMTAQENTARAGRTAVADRNGSSGNWTFLGPKQTFDTDGATEVTWQTNIYSFDIAPSDPNILYAGGESGGLWRTTDKGLHWNLLTQNVKHGAIGAVKIQPTDPNTAYFGTDGKIMKTIDGGATWTTVYTENGLWVNEIAIKPDDPNIVLAASDQGLLRSANGGTTWTKIHVQQTWTVKFQPGNPAMVFTVRKSGSSSDFRLSVDGGATFNNSNIGWWAPGAGEACTGAIVAVCPSNPAKVYAYLCASGSNLFGYAGVFVSTNGGSSWANTNQQNAIGNSPIPYSIPTHTNLMFSDGAASGFDQGFYDMAIVVNPNNANQLIAGGTSWFKSLDGGANWQALGSYVGGLGWSHPDLQCLAAAGNDLWIATDGGLNYSADFAQSIEARMNGISGADLWGFDSGWNEDVLVGGRYHNGNMAWHELFPAGKFYRMGGAESPTGYVNPGDARKTYFSDIGGYRLSGGFGDGVSYFPIGLSPNESYAYYANSEMAWDPRCWNIVYLGQENKLWKSSDGGTSYTALHTFPGVATNTVYEVEVARADPLVIYCSQWDNTDDKMWKTTDGGQSWSALTSLPLPNNNDRVKMAVSAESADVLWVAVTYGSNGKKIYKSSDGGQTWNNLTTSTLDGIRVTNIMAQYGTDGGIYLGTNAGVFYRNNNLTDWQPFSTALPLSAETNKLKPFYKTGKIRNGCWGFGVWESDLYEPSAVIAQPMASALTTNCARDTVYFDDYSVVNHTGATWSWAFSPAPQYVSATALRNPKVVFGAAGTYTATMTLNGVDEKTLTIQVTDGCDADTIPGQLVNLGGNDDPGYLAIPALNINTNTFSVTAWIKPDGVQAEYSSIFLLDGDVAAGFNFLPGSNHLGYHWPGGQWWWDSGLTVPAGQWSYVALTVSPTSVSVYVNGKKATQNITTELVNFNQSSRLGSYKGWGGRYVKGSLEEVAIWNKTLSQNEVREGMHLTKIPAEQPNLLAYYQFNETAGAALDRVGVRHAALVNNATRSTSTAPVGKGSSARLTVTGSGTYAFPNTGLTLAFPASGTYPNGELCVSRINQSPDQLPSLSPHSGSYWVVNNYGANPTFSPLSALTFNGYGPFTPAAGANGFKLFKRSSVADGNTWGTSQDDGDSFTPGPNGAVTFSTGNGITSFSQFITTYDLALPVDWSDFQVALEDNRQVRLYWWVNQTADVRRFKVEKSADGFAFQTIGTVPAKPGSGFFAYEALDSKPFKGINYYRLRQEDADGQASYSAVRSVLADALADEWVLYPNPFSSDQVLHIQTIQDTPYRFRLFDTSGKKVVERMCSGSVVMENLGLPSGVYGYEITGEQKRVTGKIMVK